MGSSLNEGFRVLLGIVGIVPYYIWDPKGYPNLESYPDGILKGLAGLSANTRVLAVGKC